MSHHGTNRLYKRTYRGTDTGCIGALEIERPRNMRPRATDRSTYAIRATDVVFKKKRLIDGWLNENPVRVT